MMPLADRFVHVYVLVDDALRAGLVPIPSRPGPAPVCSDAAGLTIARVRHLLGRPREAAFLAAVRRDWPHDFPHLPAQSEFRPRPRGTSHPSRVRGPDGWQEPGDLRAGFGRDAAHGEWFSGVRRARRTDLGTRLVRAWGIVPAGAPSGPDERQITEALLEGPRPGACSSIGASPVGRGSPPRKPRARPGVVPPGRAERRRRSAAVRRPGPEGAPVLRNRLETTNGEPTERLGLALPGAKTFWGLLTRTAATILAQTLQLLGLV